MKLVYKGTNKPVTLGDSVMTGQGERATVTYFAKPHKPSSQGKVSMRFDGTTHDSEYYVSVIGAEWIEREDRA